MAVQLSPGVQVQESDLTSVVPAVSASNGAFAGVFQWGPVLEPVLLSSENELVKQFGKPRQENFQSFFTAANFLSYATNLLVTRADTADQKNAVALTTGAVNSTVVIDSHGTGYTTVPSVLFGAPDVDGGIQATGHAVLSGMSLVSVGVATPGSGYTVAPDVIIAAPDMLGGVPAVAHATISGGEVTGIVVDTAGSGYSSAPSVSFSGGNGTNATIGTITMSTKSVASIVVDIAGSGYSSAPSITIAGNATAHCTITSGTGIKIKNATDYETNYINGAGLVGEFAAKYPGTFGNSLKVSMADSATFSTWAYKAEFSTTPSTSDYVANKSGSLDELHVIVIDEDGLWTGTQGAILEKYSFVSKASDAKSFDGTSNYYKDVINSKSEYVWWMDHTVEVGTGTAWGSEALGHTFKVMTDAISRSLAGGVDDFSATDGELLTAWTIYADDTLYDIGLLPIGKASASLATSIIGDVVEMRTDVIAFISPEDVTSGDPIIGSGKATEVNAYRNLLPSSSYAVLDTGYKYQYDRYNDKYRWVPLNGDIAGLCARTDATNDAWWSPAGLNRGQIKNVVKLAYNPNKSDRDALYSNGVNPVVTFPGQGTVLYGDKTLLSKPSAFDRINVRRLFIVLEKAIAKASRYQLFEFNDSFTQAQFKSLVEPFLRDVQGRRGITAFQVVCDSTNNTPQIINTNQFVGDIYITPNYSINFIQLNFIASKQGVAFTTTGG